MTRVAFVERLTRELAVARTQGRSADNLLTEGAAAFATRIVRTHQLVTSRTTPVPMVLAGLLGAVVGVLLVWFGLYQGVALRLAEDSLDRVAVVLILDLLAVMIILGSAVAATSIAYGRWLPALVPRLAGLAVAAALLAWPVISATATPPATP